MGEGERRRQRADGRTHTVVGRGALRSAHHPPPPHPLHRGRAALIISCQRPIQRSSSPATPTANGEFARTRTPTARAEPTHIPPTDLGIILRDHHSQLNRALIGSFNTPQILLVHTSRPRTIFCPQRYNITGGTVLPTVLYRRRDPLVRTTT